MPVTSHRRAMGLSELPGTLSRMARRWNGWYHCTAHTYGQWLRGDERGWRARHHREHCEGDYKNRPDPEAHADKLRWSKHHMNKAERDPVRIMRSMREVVLLSIVERLTEFGVYVLVAGLDGVHLHILAKFTEHDQRIKLGIAKQFATKTLKAHCAATGIDLGLKLGEGIWGKRSRAAPIKDRDHQVYSVGYILEHEARGAVTYLIDELLPKKSGILKSHRARKNRRR